MSAWYGGTDNILVERHARDIVYGIEMDLNVCNKEMGTCQTNLCMRHVGWRVWLIRLEGDIIRMIMKLIVAQAIA